MDCHDCRLTILPGRRDFLKAAYEAKIDAAVKAIPEPRR